VGSSSLVGVAAPLLPDELVEPWDDVGLW
jgi:hypothetical protein